MDSHPPLVLMAHWKVEMLFNDWAQLLGHGANNQPPAHRLRYPSHWFLQRNHPPTSDNLCDTIWIWPLGHPQKNLSLSKLKVRAEWTGCPSNTCLPADNSPNFTNKRGFGEF